MNTVDIAEIAKKTIPELNGMGDIYITSISGGFNNKSYLIQNKNYQFFAKQYFHKSLEKRDRLLTEFSFSQFAWNNHIRCISRPIAQDIQAAFGFYEYIQGKKLTETEIQNEHILQAFNFLLQLNNNRALVDDSVHDASEACFSINQHIHLVEQRIENFDEIIIQDEIDQETIHFIQNELVDHWTTIKDHLFSIQDKKIINKIISNTEKILSPSDFGFHNAILTNQNQLKFFDFEYAGWDDPAKLVCDFFCQPQVPVSMQYFSTIIKYVMNITAESNFLLDRIYLLFPIIKIKWCCIALNCFVPKFKLQKSFVHDLSQEFRLNQLNKAKNIIHSLKNSVF